MIDSIRFKRNNGPKESKNIQDRLIIIDLLDEGYTHREVKSITGKSLSCIRLIAQSNAR